MEPIKTYNNAAAIRPATTTKIQVPVYYVNNENVKALVVTDVYEKYPIQLSAFRRYFYEETESQTAQLNIGFVRKIEETADGAMAIVEIANKYMELLNTSGEPMVLQVLSNFDKETRVTTITKYRLISEKDYAEINTKRTMARRQQNNGGQRHNTYRNNRNQ